MKNGEGILNFFRIVLEQNFQQIVALHAREDDVIFCDRRHGVDRLSHAVAADQHTISRLSLVYPSLRRNLLLFTLRRSFLLLTSRCCCYPVMSARCFCHNECRRSSLLPIDLICCWLVVLLGLVCCSSLASASKLAVNVNCLGSMLTNSTASSSVSLPFKK